MVTFYQTSDSGELVEVDFSNLENFALKEEYHADSLSKDTLNFDELLEKGIYVYSDFENAENEEGKWPEALTDGYILILVEDNSKAQRGITQILLDSSNGSYYRRGILTESENVFEDWHSLDSDTNFTTNLSLGKGSPATTDGIWTEISNLSYNIQLWKQVNTISTMADAGGRTTNVVLNDIATLALSGAQTIYVRDSTGAFSKICLDISNGGTGATTAAAARTALGAASQTDLNSLRNSVDNTCVRFNTSLLSQSWVSQQSADAAGTESPQVWRLSIYGKEGNYILVGSLQNLTLWDIDTEQITWSLFPYHIESRAFSVSPASQSYKDITINWNYNYRVPPMVTCHVSSTFTAAGGGYINNIAYAITSITTSGATIRVHNENSVTNNITFRIQAIGY